MTDIAEIHSGLPLSEIEQHHRDRDVEVQRLRGEMLALHKLMEPKRIARELERSNPQGARTVYVGETMVAALQRKLETLMGFMKAKGIEPPADEQEKK